MPTMEHISTFTAIAWQEQVLLRWDDDDDHDDHDDDQIGRVMVSTLISSGVAYKNGEILNLVYWKVMSHG
jgi:hypothetical protein